MKNDDSFGVELDLNITKFKNKIKQATTISTEFSKKIEKTRHFGQNAFGDIVEIKQVNNELIKQNRLYSEQQQMLNSITKLNRNKLALSTLGTTNLTEGNNYSGYIASFKKATVEEKKEIKDLNNEIEKTGDISTRTGNEISNAFNKGLKSVKKLTIGFLGVRTAFGLFRKYMSEYSRENEVFAQKMQLTSSVVANALAPAFEFFGNVIQYTVIGLARVVELLFGVNILGRTVDNSLKGASKSAKELNDNLSGLDEISNIDKETGGLDTGISSQLDALNDFKKKIEEVKELFQKWGVDKKIETIKNFLSDLWNSQTIQFIRDAIGKVIDWSIKHPNAVATILGGMALVDLIGKIMGTTGGTGLLGLVSNIKYLSTVGTIAIVLTLTYAAKEKVEEFINDKMDELDEGVEKIEKHIQEKGEKIEKDINEGNAEEIQKTYDTTIENYHKTMEGLSKVYDAVNNPVFRFGSNQTLFNKEKLEQFDNELQSLQKSAKELYNQTKTMYESKMLNEDEIDKFKGMIDMQIQFAAEIGYTKNEVDGLIDEYMELDTSVESIDRMTEYMRNLGYTEDEITEKLTPYFFDLKYGINDSKKSIDDMGKSFSSIFEKKYNLKINISAAVNALNAAGSLASQTLQSLNLKVPGYDVGTDYVPRDQLAMVHEGERIIPKKYNNPQYLGELGNSETNTLLMELNRNVLEFAKRPSVISINGKELAKATYNDYQEEGSRRGTNTSVRRI